MVRLVSNPDFLCEDEDSLIEQRRNSVSTWLDPRKL